MDALYGCPPNVFPFDRQYGRVEIEKRITRSYAVRLDDPSVQEALARQGGVRVIGPNCFGIYCPGSGLTVLRRIPETLQTA